MKARAFPGVLGVSPSVIGKLRRPHRLRRKVANVAALLSHLNLRSVILEGMESSESSMLALACVSHRRSGWLSTVQPRQAESSSKRAATAVCGVIRSPGTSYVPVGTQMLAATWGRAAWQEARRRAWCAALWTRTARRHNMPGLLDAAPATYAPADRSTGRQA